MIQKYVIPKYSIYNMSSKYTEGNYNVLVQNVYGPTTNNAYHKAYLFIYFIYLSPLKRRKELHSLA